MVAAAFFVRGIGNLIPFAHIVRDMAHLGYPSYFMKILGTWKILAGMAVVHYASAQNVDSAALNTDKNII